MDLRDHLAHQAESVGNQEHLLLNVHNDDLLGELDQQLDGFGDVIQFKEVLLLLEVEEDLAHDYPQREVEDLIVKVGQVEGEVLSEDSLQELDQVLDLD